jgi:hypothetical protein
MGSRFNSVLRMRSFSGSVWSQSLGTGRDPVRDRGERLASQPPGSPLGLEVITRRPRSQGDPEPFPKGVGPSSRRRRDRARPWDPNPLVRRSCPSGEGRNPFLAGIWTLLFRSWSLPGKGPFSGLKDPGSSHPWDLRPETGDFGMGSLPRSLAFVRSHPGEGSFEGLRP